MMTRSFKRWISAWTKGSQSLLRSSECSNGEPFDDILHEVYSDVTDLHHYSRSLRFEPSEVVDLDQLNDDKRSFLDFKFGPSSEIFSCKRLSLTSDNKVYKTIDLSNGKFLNLLKTRYQVMQNPRKEFLRHLVRIEYLGKYIFKESVFSKLALDDLESCQRLYIIGIKDLNRKLRSEKYKANFFFNIDGQGKKSHENRVLMTRLSSGKIKTISPFYLYIGLSFLELGRTDSLTSKILKDYFPSKRTFVNNSKDTELIKHINAKVSNLLPKHTRINKNLFYGILRPKLFPFKPARLPPLPKLQHPSETNALMKLALIHPFSKHIRFKHRPSLNRMARSLDALGDLVIKRVSFEYFYNILLKKMNHISVLSDHLLLNSNILLGNLAKAYSLDLGLEGNAFHEDLVVNMRKDMTKDGSKSIEELYGDIFEKVVAVMYLDNPQICETWLINIFDVIYNTLAVEKFDGKQFDRSYLMKYITPLMHDN